MDNTRNNIILVKQALREYYNNENRRWQKRQELFSLKKGEQTLDTYIDKINKLSQQLDVGAEVKIDLFINGLDERLSNALKMRQPRTYEDAITFARLKDGTKSSGETTMEKILEALKVGNLISTDKEQASPVAKLQKEVNSLKQEVHKEKVAAIHTNPTDNLREIARLKEENRRLKQNKNIDDRRDFQPTGKNLRTQTGEVICMRCYKVGHYQRSCPEMRYNGKKSVCSKRWKLWIEWILERTYR